MLSLKCAHNERPLTAAINKAQLSFNCLPLASISVMCVVCVYLTHTTQRTALVRRPLIEVSVHLRVWLPVFLNAVRHLLSMHWLSFAGLRVCFCRISSFWLTFVRLLASFAVFRRLSLSTG